MRSAAVLPAVSAVVLIAVSIAVLAAMLIDAVGSHGVVMLRYTSQTKDIWEPIFDAFRTASAEALKRLYRAY